MAYRDQSRSAEEDRALLEWLAKISPRHEIELCRQRDAEAKAIRDRNLLEWLSVVAPDYRRDRDSSFEHETRAGCDASAELLKFVETISVPDGVIQVREGNWDPAKHPRRGGPPNAGWFASTGTISGGNLAADPSDHSQWYLPSNDKGTWSGARGNSTFRLKTPVNVDGRLVHEIEFRRGLPVLEDFALPGKTATIVLTGDHGTDIQNAKKAWERLNRGMLLPEESTFHHDLLHATEATVTLNGKKTKVVVGKMHLVPRDINKSVFHEGSASLAKKYYQGLGTDVGAVRKLASDEAAKAAIPGTIVARAAKSIAPGKISKGILPFVGRGVKRAIPLVGTGLALIEFSDNVQAHGVGGAMMRATPVLGDLVSAHDLGSDLAKQIRDEANAAADAHMRAINKPVDEAWNKATQQAVDAFQELAPKIEVTNEYGPNGLVDPYEVTDALKVYRGKMQQLNLLKAHQAKGFDYATAAAQAKHDLHERLTKAAQKDVRPTPKQVF